MSRTAEASRGPAADPRRPSALLPCVTCATHPQGALRGAWVANELEKDPRHAPRKEFRSVRLSDSKIHPLRPSICVALPRPRPSPSPPSPPSPLNPELASGRRGAVLGSVRVVMEVDGELWGQDTSRTARTVLALGAKDTYPEQGAPLLCKKGRPSPQQWSHSLSRRGPRKDNDVSHA